MNIIELIRSSLARKLIVSLITIIIIGGSVSAYILIGKARDNLINNVIEYTASHSELVKKSTHYSMLTFQRDAIQQIVQSIGAKKDINRIRIFDGRGKVFYSSDRQELGDTVDSTSFVCVGCHTDPGRPLETLKHEKRYSISRDEQGTRVLTYVSPIFNEPSCHTAACHAHSPEQRVLGVLETDFSLHSVDQNVRGLILESALYTALFMIIGAVILYFILLRLVVKPVSTLSAAMKKVTTGDLSQNVSISSGDEMSSLASSFNAMTGELAIARERMEKWTQSLEDEVARKSEELKNSRDRLIQAEKLASLGRLTSDIAHEIRNPLTVIGGFTRRLYKLVKGKKEKETAEIMISEVDRLEKILRDTLTFSREAKYNFLRSDVRDVVHESVKFYEDVCQEQSIQVRVVSEEDIPPLIIDRDQVRQAFLNLIANAIDAMSSGGTLTVALGKEDLHGATYVFIRVTDTGKGIPEESLPLVFEPFFSTKEIHGTGLGLSISRKIMEEHGGFIMAESTEGEGTTISLHFPYQGEEESNLVNCWDYMKCNRDRDNSDKCPAYPHFGRICWSVAGTFCQGKVRGTFAQKLEDCRSCRFYQRIQTGSGL